MPHVIPRLLVATLLASTAALAVGCSAARPEGRESPPSDGSHTVLIVLENHELDEVIGSPEFPYLTKLARRGALAVQFHAIGHPSLPNYLALAGGSTFGIASDCTECTASGPNIATQLAARGISWRAYMGGMPSACSPEAESGAYAKRHNPFMYFPSIYAHRRLCGQDVPEGELDEAISEHALPRFAWITPGLCDDAHSCGLEASNRYLRGLVPRLLRQLGPHGLLVVTFDEGTSSSQCCHGAGGGRVATVLVGPEVRSGARLRHPYSDYSLLATLEDRLGVPRLRNARDATSMQAAFVQRG